MIKQRSNLVLPKSLYAIGNSKDELNLHTGELTHRIRKIVFDGTENWKASSSVSGAMWLSDLPIDYYRQFRQLVCICSHYKSKPCDSNLTNLLNNEMTLYAPQTQMQAQYHETYFRDTRFTNATDWKQFLSDEYTNGTPVTIWYVLAEPTTETITISEGLSGIVEGYLIQDGTPTPTNPIYPTSCDSVDMWNEIMYRQYGVNETLSPIPTTVFSQGDGIDSCTVYGNTVQNGTPTPTDPVDINGVGMNENLFSSEWEQGSIGITGVNESSSARIRTAGFIGVRYNTIYSITRSKSGSFVNLRFYAADKSFIGVGTISTISLITGYTEGNPMYTTEKFCCFKIIDPNIAYMRLGDQTNNLSTKYMMVEGEYTSETMPAYVPYGYKVPINVDSQIANIYLGTTQSTRRIQKLVLTGDETYDRVRVSDDIAVFATTILNEAISAQSDQVLSTHYIGSYSTDVGSVYIGSSTTRLCFVDEYATPSAFKQYLQQQYQAGTPVTIYYVLAEPQTTTLNEPLMKIGDYADSVTYSSNIPTTYGQNDITTDTQIKPSKLDITYNALRRAKVYKNDRWILNPSIDWSQTLKISDLQSKKIKEMEGEYIGYNIHT